jgi:hypothetical protein
VTSSVPVGSLPFAACRSRLVGLRLLPPRPCRDRPGWLPAPPDGSSRSSDRFAPDPSASRRTTRGDPPRLRLLSRALTWCPDHDARERTVIFLSWGSRPDRVSRRRRTVSTPPSTTRTTDRLAPTCLPEPPPRWAEPHTSTREGSPPPDPEAPTSRSRSDLAVSHRLAGFLRARAADVAACCRPWGSLRFRHAVRRPRASRSAHHPSKDLPSHQLPPRSPAAIAPVSLGSPASSGSPDTPCDAPRSPATVRITWTSRPCSDARSVSARRPLPIDRGPSSLGFSSLPDPLARGRKRWGRQRTLRGALPSV